MERDELSGSSRDILIEVRGLVKQLVESRDDHETRIRVNEKEVADLRTSKREQAEQTRRLLAWGMLLAAAAGGFGNLIAKALTR
jgi:hypothetical protein